MCFKHFHKDLFVALSFIPSPLPLIYFREANRLLFPEVLHWKTAFLKPALHPRFLSRLSSDCITKNSRRITSIEVSNNVQSRPSLKNGIHLRSWTVWKKIIQFCFCQLATFHGKSRLDIWNLQVSYS